MGARFDHFEIDLVSGELRVAGGPPARIQQLPLQVLRLLMEAEGRVVTRDQLRTALWSENTFVDFDHSVNTAIKKLRQALGDSFENQRLVETVPKVGYRFLAPVEWVTDGKEALPTRMDTQEPSGAAMEPRKRPRLATTIVVASLAICAVAAYLVYKIPLVRTKKPEPSLSLAVTNVGEKFGPSLSPDGQQLAYAWNGGSGPHFSIYVKLFGTEQSLRLTKQESVDFDPVWSPDGRYVAFCRIQKGQTGIYIVSAFGGPERKVRDAHWEEREFYEVFWYFGRLSWSPDGKSLAFSDREASNEPTGIFLLSLDTLGVRRLTSPGLSGDYNPVFSPDGRTLGFNRGSQGVESIWTLPLAGGREQRLERTEDLVYRSDQGHGLHHGGDRMALPALAIRMKMRLCLGKRFEPWINACSFFRAIRRKTCR